MSDFQCPRNSCHGTGASEDLVATFICTFHFVITLSKDLFALSKVVAVIEGVRFSLDALLLERGAGGQVEP